MWGYVVGPDEGVEGYDPGVKASATSTNGALTVLVERDTTGGAPRHIHHREDEAFLRGGGLHRRRVR